MSARNFRRFSNGRYEFWSVIVARRCLLIRFGHSGTETDPSKDERGGENFDTEEEALVGCERLIRQKLNEGFEEITPDESPGGKGRPEINSPSEFHRAVEELRAGLGKPIVKVYLERSPITDEAFAKYAPYLTQMRCLNLRLTAITDKLLASVKDKTALESLSLEQCDISDAGMMCLKNLGNLTDLNLSQTKITDAGLREIRRLTKMRHLSVDETNITDAGLQYLTGMKNMRSLALGCTRITDAGLIRIKDFIELDYLDLYDTEVTDAGLKHLHRLYELGELIVDETKISDEGIERLERILPKLSGRGRW